MWCVLELHWEEARDLIKFMAHAARAIFFLLVFPLCIDRPVSCQCFWHIYTTLLNISCMEVEAELVEGRKCTLMYILHLFLHSAGFCLLV